MKQSGRLRGEYRLGGIYEGKVVTQRNPGVASVGEIDAAPGNAKERETDLRKQWMKVLCGTLAAVTMAVSAVSGNVWLGGALVASAAGTENGVAQKAGDEWAGVEAESEETRSGEDAVGVPDEFGCNLQPWHTCYKYEYAYRTRDTSGLEGEEMAFYEGLKGYLDYAYQFNTPYEQEKAIHDYMVLNCKYAEEYYIDGKLNDDVWNYDGVFVHGQAVCQGYALSFKLCMDILGIESQVIVGSTPEGKHAWNAVKLDGEWYYVDATWDDPLPDAEGRVLYHYFNMPRWWMDTQHETKTTFEVEGTKYSGDDVVFMTTDSDGKALGRMLLKNMFSEDQHTILRMYLAKGDGSTWTKEEVQNYNLDVGIWVPVVYNVYRIYATEGEEMMCFSFQGREGVIQVLGAMFVVIVLILILVIAGIRRMIKKRKQKREKSALIETGKHEIESHETGVHEIENQEGAK